MKNHIKIFRKIALLEGISYLLLFAVTMPLKYYFSMPEPNYIVGSLHGLLFVLYCIYSIIVFKEIEEWTYSTLGLVLLASILPFGTFYMDAKLLKQYDK